MNSQKPKFSLKTSLEEREKQLLEMSDEEIDFSDCPEITPEMLAKGTVRRVSNTLDRDTYGSLLAEYLPKVIENDAENEQAITLAEALSHRKKRSLEETTLLNLLLTLIEKYEQENYPIEESEPHSILWELMEANNLQEKDLSDILGSKTIVSDILIGKQIITEEQAVKLGNFFHVDSSLFLSTQ